MIHETYDADSVILTLLFACTGEGTNDYYEGNLSDNYIIDLGGVTIAAFEEANGDWSSITRYEIADTDEDRDALWREWDHRKPLEYEEE